MKFPLRYKNTIGNPLYEIYVRITCIMLQDALVSDDYSQ